MKRIIKNWESADYAMPPRQLIAFRLNYKLFIICNQCNYLQTDIPRVYGKFSNNDVPQVIRCVACNKVGFGCYNNEKIKAATCTCGGKYQVIKYYTCPCCRREIDLDLPKPISPISIYHHISEEDHIRMTTNSLGLNAKRMNFN